MLRDAACEDCSLRRGQVDLQSGLLHFFKGAANSRIRLAFEQAAFSVVLTIGHHCFTNSVVPIRPQQDLHHVFEWRPNRTLYVEVFIRCPRARYYYERTDPGTIRLGSFARFPRPLCKTVRVGLLIRCRAAARVRKQGADARAGEHWQTLRSVARSGNLARGPRPIRAGSRT